MSIRRALTGFYYGVKIAVKVPGIAIQWYTRRNKAKDRFRKELIANGIPSKDAKKLADGYPFKLGDLINLTRNTSNP